MSPSDSPARPPSSLEPSGGEEELLPLPTLASSSPSDWRKLTDGLPRLSGSTSSLLAGGTLLNPAHHEAHLEYALDEFANEDVAFHTAVQRASYIQSTVTPDQFGWATAAAFMARSVFQPLELVWQVYLARGKGRDELNHAVFLGTKASHHPLLTWVGAMVCLVVYFGFVEEEEVEESGIALIDVWLPFLAFVVIQALIGIHLGASPGIMNAFYRKRGLKILLNAGKVADNMLKAQETCEVPWGESFFFTHVETDRPETFLFHAERDGSFAHPEFVAELKAESDKLRSSGNVIRAADTFSGRETIDSGSGGLMWRISVRAMARHVARSVLKNEAVMPLSMVKFARLLAILTHFLPMIARTADGLAPLGNYSWQACTIFIVGALTPIYATWTTYRILFRGVDHYRRLRLLSVAFGRMTSQRLAANHGLPYIALLDHPRNVHSWFMLRRLCNSYERKKHMNSDLCMEMCLGFLMLVDVCILVSIVVISFTTGRFRSIYVYVGFLVILILTVSLIHVIRDGSVMNSTNESHAGNLTEVLAQLDVVLLMIDRNDQGQRARLRHMQSQLDTSIKLVRVDNSGKAYLLGVEISPSFLRVMVAGLTTLTGLTLSRVLVSSAS